MKKDILSSESKKSGTVAFERINDQFRRYWKYLFSLIFIYSASYIVWAFLISKWLRGFLDSRRYNPGKNFWFIVLGAAIIQGILFCMDGVVSALLKSPFNQMCYAINKAEGISYKKKDSIITKATESNEHCKETLKKFGILTICGEVARIIIEGAKGAGDRDKYGDYWLLLNISYLIPLMFATYRIWQIHKELKKIKKTMSGPTLYTKKVQQINNFKQ